MIAGADPPSAQLRCPFVYQLNISFYFHALQLVSIYEGFERIGLLLPNSGLDLTSE